MIVKNAVLLILPLTKNIMAEKVVQVVDVERITIQYENGTRVSVRGDRARKIAALFFQYDKGIENTDWEIENINKKASRPFTKKIDDYIYKIMNSIFGHK